MNSKLQNIPKPNVINLKECPDRKRYTISEWEKYGGETLEIHSYDRYVEGESIPFAGDEELLKKATKGVASSHLLTIKKWYETTDEPYGIFLEDDVDYSTIEHWNFTLSEFIEKCNDYAWSALQLGLVFEYPYYIYREYPLMAPRRRNIWDHGLQCYVLKRECAQKIVQFYFSFEEALTGKQVINYSMPLNAPDAFENNVLHGFGKVIVFPLFNHNVTDFRSKNIYYYNQMAASAIYSYEFLKDWWEKKGSSKSLEEIFENAQL